MDRLESRRCQKKNLTNVARAPGTTARQPTVRSTRSGRRFLPLAWLAKNRGNSGPTNVKHYLSWSEGTVFNRSCYVGAGTDEVFEAWTRAPQIVRPNGCHPAGDEAFLGSWLRRYHLRRPDRGDEAKPVELLPRGRQQRE